MAPPVNFRNTIQRGKDAEAEGSDTVNDLRDNWPDHRDGQIHGRSMGLLDSSRIPTDSLPRVRIGEDFPSRILLVFYPASVIIDEKMLYGAMILFGEIENIKNFSSKKYALVKFRSIDEARCAKDGLCGRLFNDPRIIIMYSNSDHVPDRMIPDLDALNWQRLSLAPSSSIQTNNDLREYIWHGNIAKGGSIICRARCVAVGLGIDSDLPEMIDCSARTGLETLTKHYADAIGFGMVFFLPDTERDFPSYTNFLQYLVNKNRAGVAKLDDGTTLFLVPPSDFLTKVLNIVGPEHLYGVVLKFPPILETGVSQTPSSQYGNRQQTPVLNSLMHTAMQSNGAESSQTALAPIVFTQNHRTPNQTSTTFSVQPIIPNHFQGPSYFPPVGAISLRPEQSTYQGFYRGPPHPFQGFPTTYSGQPIVSNHFQVSYLPPVGTTPDVISFSNSVNQPHGVVPPATENVRTESPNLVHPSFYGVGQVTSNFKVDENQWDQSTLQFAANILEQIHQHESSTQIGQVPPRN